MSNSIMICRLVKYPLFLPEEFIDFSTCSSCKQEVYFEKKYAEELIKICMNCFERGTGIKVVDKEDRYIKLLDRQLQIVLEYEND